MPNNKRKEYRGYRIEAALPDARGWRVTVYRLKPSIPNPLRPSDIRYPSATSAMAAGHRDIDWLLQKCGFPVCRQIGGTEKPRPRLACETRKIPLNINQTIPLRRWLHERRRRAAV